MRVFCISVFGVALLIHAVPPTVPRCWEIPPHLNSRPLATFPMKKIIRPIEIFSYHVHRVVYPHEKRQSLCSFHYGRRESNMLSWLWVKCFTEKHCRKSNMFWRNHHD